MSGQFEDALCDLQLDARFGPGAAEREALMQAYTAMRPGLCRCLKTSYPRSCDSRIDDAAQTAALAMLEQPEHFYALLLRSKYELQRRLITVAWRALRGELRRHCHRFEIADDRRMRVASQLPGQEIAAELRTGWPRALRAAAEASGAADHDALERALAERFTTGETDTAVAARTGLRREYINRGRLQVERELLSALGLG